MRINTFVSNEASGPWKKGKLLFWNENLSVAEKVHGDDMSVGVLYHSYDSWVVFPSMEGKSDESGGSPDAAWDWGPV